MKYAFIALIAIYLVIYGCSPDESDKASDSHEKTAISAVDNSQKSEETVAPVVQHEPADETAKQAPAVVEEKIASEEQPVTEEGKSAEIADPTDPILAFKVVEQAPGEQAVASEQVVMPCGRIMARADIPENAPCLNMQPQDTQDTAATPGNEQELATALQKMVDTTNNMIQATRQLVIATQELLDANKKADEETQPAQQETGSQVPAPTQQ